MIWSIVVPIFVSVVMSIVSIVFYRRARKRAVTPEQKLNLNRIMFVCLIVGSVVGVWWGLRF
jgi:membrane protein implicated in regulation of membrane protease activity